MKSKMVPRGVRTLRGRCSVDFTTQAIAPDGQAITTPGLHAFSLGDGTVRLVVVAGGAGELAVCDVVIPEALGSEYGGIVQRMAKFSREGKPNGIACGLPSWGRESASSPTTGIAAVLGAAMAVRASEPPNEAG